MKRKEQKTRDSSILEVGQVRRQHTLGVLRITRHEEPFRDLESPGEPPFPTLPGPLESDAKADPESSLAQVTASSPPSPSSSPVPVWILLDRISAKNRFFVSLRSEALQNGAIR